MRRTEKRKWLLETDAICVESQIRTTVTMKVLSHTVQCFFNIIKLHGFTNTQVCIVSPSLKLNKNNIKRRHKKQTAIEHARLLLASKPDALTVFQSFKKKDDIANAILQALDWLEENEIINQNQNEIVIET